MATVSSSISGVGGIYTYTYVFDSQLEGKATGSFEVEMSTLINVYDDFSSEGYKFNSTNGIVKFFGFKNVTNPTITVGFTASSPPGTGTATLKATSNTYSQLVDAPAPIPEPSALLFLLVGILVLNRRVLA